MKRGLVFLWVTTLIATACGRADTVTTTTALTVPATTSSTTVPATTTIPAVPTDTTFPLPPVPVITAPATAPRARLAAPPCDDPDGSHYCIWGTMPIDLTVTNSRFATFTASVTQSFVAMTDAMGAVRTVLGGDGVGGFTVAPVGAMPAAVCVSTILATETGVEVARVDLSASGTSGALEEIVAPLAAGLLPGARYQVELRVMPGCANRRFTTLVAMSSDWKYPAGSGMLTVDDRRSIGSLWARVD